MPVLPTLLPEGHAHGGYLAAGVQPPELSSTPAQTPEAPPFPPSSSLRIEGLRGWHLPLLDDPAFLPLQPLLQKALLLAWPERLMSLIAPRRALAPSVLVALHHNPQRRSRVLGLIAYQRVNRTGTCWQVRHLRTALSTAEDPTTPSRQTVATGLLREAIHSVTGAASWIATSSSLDPSRLALLRQQGFQPLRTDRLWRWTPEAQSRQQPHAQLPGELQLRPLNRRNACLLWHLEQAAWPALLRQLLDRRVEDLQDQSDGRGWLLIDASRNEAVAGIRWLEDHPAGGDQVQFSLHPGWRHLLGPATDTLLHRFHAGRERSLWLLSEAGDSALGNWFEAIGAEDRGEEVLMARSVWRRQDPQPARKAVRRLAAVLDQLQPRRRPVPTPLTSMPRPWSRGDLPPL